MESDKKLFKNLATSNSRLADDINQLTNITKHDDTATATKVLLLKLYNSIIQLAERRGHPPAPNKTIVEAYHSFFEPIDALAKLPNGDFISARMYLYLASAFTHDRSLNLRFSESKAPGASAFLYEFCVTIDDALLEPLKKIWKNGNKSDEFNWVFSDYTVRLQGSGNHTFHHLELAQALSPEELMVPGGGQGRHWFWSALGGEPHWKPFTGKYPEVNDEEIEKLLWKCVGTDGPIREDRLYRTIGRDACEESYQAVEVLRRSRQFIFDARHIAKSLITKQKISLLKRILFMAGVPAEVREMVWQHMDEPRKEPNYLSNLDITAAYVPFPKQPGPCAECKARKARGKDRGVKYTCPDATIYLWNLGLRLFHVFHQKTKTGWWPCKEGVECSGHHEDDDWQVKSYGAFFDLLEDINAERNESFTEFWDDNYEELPLLFLSNLNEDDARSDGLFSGRGPLEDSVREEMLMDGISGLKGLMKSNDVLLGASRGPNGSRQVIVETQWAVGRNLVEQTKAEDGISKLLSSTAEAAV